MQIYCKTCRKTNLFEKEPSVGFVCTVCGLVSENSDASDLEIVGRALEASAGGEYDVGGVIESGRVHLHDGGRTYAGGTARIGRDLVKGIQRAEHYQEMRMAASERYMRSVLSHFDLAALFTRSKFIFDQVKRIGGFNWGKRAKIFSVASLYVASREREKGLLISELAAVTEVNLSTLTRAQKTIKSWLHIQTAELDPIVFLETHIVHFTELLASSPSPPLSGSKRPTWSPANLVWVRSLKMTEIRKLATGLCSFSQSLKLSSNRSPAQVSCAIVAVAMEGIARRRAPNITEFQDEMAHLLGVARFTVAERYRELHKALADFAPGIPWISDLGSANAKKSGLLQYIDDVVKFRTALEEKHRRNLKYSGGDGRLLSHPEAHLLRSEDDGSGEPDFPPDSKDRLSGDEYIDTDVDHDEEDLVALLPDPLTEPRATARLLDPANVNTILKKKRGYRFVDRVTEQEDQSGVHKRPAEYMRQRPQGAKKVYTIEDAASSLILSLTPAEDKVLRPQSILPVAKVTNINKVQPPKASAPHSQTSVEFRRLLLAGHEPIEIFKGIAQEDLTAHSGRLRRLLLEKSVMEIKDDELFAEGELESMFRSREEVELLYRSGRFADIPDVELGALVAQQVAEASLFTSDNSDVAERGSEPKSSRRSKINQATKDRLERLFNGEPEDEDSFDTMGIREEMQIGTALNGDLLGDNDEEDEADEADD